MKVLEMPYNRRISELTRRLNFDLFLSETTRRQILDEISRLTKERDRLKKNLERLYNWR